MIVGAYGAKIAMGETMIIKKIIRRMLAMHPAAWYIFINSIKLSCAILAVSVLLFAAGSEPYQDSLISAAIALSELPQAILLLAVIVSVCIEDRLT